MKVGDYFKLGHYSQNNGDVKEPIEWLVLDVSGDEALLISRYGLDCKQYHSENVETTWEECDLRKWLNNDFLEVAFSDEERKKIKVSNLKNNDNSEFENCGGNSTEDQVFCLSIAEAKQYFKNDKARQCQPTSSLAKQHRLFIKDGYCGWLLRSPSREQSVWVVYVDGSICLGSYPNDVNDGAVRPAIRIICNQ